jgi:hypothetical protein
MNVSKRNQSHSGEAERRDFAAPLGEAREGELVFVRGVSLITIDVNSAMPDLYRAHFEGPVPKVQAHDGSVIVQYRRFSLAEWAKYALLWSRHTARITLNSAIPWRIEIRGGVSKLTADLRGLRLSALEVRGGASEIAMLLPTPSGAVAIRVAGGASNVMLQRPEGVAVGVHVRGGASKLTFDEQHFGAIGGDVRLATPGHAHAADRYDIRIAGGASKLTVATT